MSIGGLHEPAANQNSNQQHRSDDDNSVCDGSRPVDFRLIRHGRFFPKVWLFDTSLRLRASVKVT